MTSIAGPWVATMGTVSTEQARDFYRAAANFYRQAPWRTVGEGETIEIRCQQLSGGPWYAVILGKMINIKGLMLFDDREGRRLMQRANYELIADRLRTIAVHYEDAGQANPKDVAAVREQGFEVAGPNAYPLAFRMETGRHFREPHAWELELLEACLWMIPDFLKRAQDRMPDVYEYAFDGAIGRMSLDLAWVRVDRSRSADTPGKSTDRLIRGPGCGPPGTRGACPRPDRPLCRGPRCTCRPAHRRGRSPRGRDWRTPRSVDQQGHVPLALDRIERVLRQDRPLGRHPHRPQPSSDGHRALGDLVRELGELPGDLVEQLVELVEFLALDVPVGLLGLRVEVEDARQALIQQLDQRRPLLGRDVHLGAELPRLGLRMCRHWCILP